MKLLYGHYLSIYIFILFINTSCYYRAPYALTVKSVKYEDTLNIIEIKLNEFIKMSRNEVDWKEICIAEGNTITGSYFDDYIICLELLNTYNPVTDRGKKVFFNDKFFKAQENEVFGDYWNYYIINESELIEF